MTVAADVLACKTAYQNLQTSATSALGTANTLAKQVAAINALVFANRGLRNTQDELYTRARNQTVQQGL